MEILPQLLINALISGSIYAMASSGLSLTYGLLRILNFAHGHLMMCGAYLFFFASVQLGLGLLSAAALTACLSVVLAIFTLRVFVLPFSRFSFILTLVTTLALSNVLEAAVSMAFGVNVKSLALGTAGQSLQFGSVYITPIQILIIASALGILSTIAFVVHSTSFGRKVRALSEDLYSAQSLAVSASRINHVVYVGAVLLAAYAGVLVGYETNMQPTMGTSYTIKAFAAMILGGLGNLWGTIAGAYLLGLIENVSIGLEFGSYSLPAGYKDAFAFLIILLVLLFRPYGLFRRAPRAA